MEYSPPPLFKQGAPARVKVTVFALISIGLLMLDSRVHMLGVARQVAGTVLYPFQMAALMPRNALANMGDYFTSLSEMQREVRVLKSQQLLTAQALQQAQMQVNENVQLRRLLEAREHVPVKSIMSEILYDARDPATRKIVLDRGSRSDVVLGLPVIDNSGVVGQVTRVFPFTSEVTLLTDKEQAIPVQVLRNGLRSVAYGRGQSGLLDLRFVAPSADVQVGDVLITSGLDGIYPAGLAVAKVIQVESAAGNFSRVVCQPLAGVDRHRQLLILMEQPSMLPRPAAEPAAAPTGKSKALPKMAPIMTPAVPLGGVTAPAGTAPAAGNPLAPARTAPAPAVPAAGNPLAPARTGPAPAVPAAATARPPAAGAAQGAPVPARVPAANGGQGAGAGTAPATTNAARPVAPAANPAARPPATATTAPARGNGQ